MKKDCPGLLAAIALMAIAATAPAEPFRPTNPDQVFLHTPRLSTTLAEADARLSLDAALTFAATQIDEGKRLSEPRMMGRAEALLVRWQPRAADDARWNVLMADIRQHRHNYPDALRLLDRAVAIDNGNSRAFLMRASIRQTQGDFTAARSDCAALLANSERALGTACLAQILGLTGHLVRATELLEGLLDANDSPAVRSWLLTGLADMLERRGHVAEAGQRLREALSVDPYSSYARLALADLMLANGRAGEIDRILSGAPRSPSTLLRRYAAARALGQPTGQYRRQLFGRIRQTSERGEKVDHRELARLHQLDGRHCDALSAARANWQEQREPVDVRLFLETALDCGSTDDVRAIIDWRHANNYEDAMLDAWLPRVRTLMADAASRR